MLVYSQDRAIVKTLQGSLAKSFVFALEGDAVGYFAATMTGGKTPDIAAPGKRLHGLEWS